MPHKIHPSQHCFLSIGIKATVKLAPAAEATETAEVPQKKVTTVTGSQIKVTVIQGAAVEAVITMVSYQQKATSFLFEKVSCLINPIKISFFIFLI